MSLNVLSLFAGIGGLDLGLERAGMTVIGQVEIDPYCQRVLAKHWPDVPRHDDVRTAADWWRSTERPAVDVICGGFPCQDISPAGRRAGIINGERSGLWSAMAEFVRRVRPRYVLVENSPRVLVRARDGFIPAEVIAADLAALGYDLRWDCIPAAAVGAPHLRDRWFCVAHAQRMQLRLEPVPEPGSGGSAEPRNNGATEPVADSARGRRPDEPRGRDTEGLTVCAVAVRSGRSSRIVASIMADADSPRLTDLQGWETFAERARVGAVDRAGWWRSEPDVGRVVDGLPARLDRSRRRARVRGLGNAVVPQVAEYVGRLIVSHAASLDGAA